MTDEKTATRRPWRENIEALTMAIAVALLFKVFILEISKIPSGSMQPTLMGSPEANVFDRVLVDKLTYSYRDPERFEIVVFKHPLEQSRVMVKRLVGLPNESLKIENGDLWRRDEANPEWTPIRRPAPVQEAMWRRLDRLDKKRSSWAQEDGVDWRLEGQRIEATSAGRARYRPDEGTIADVYTDGYHDSMRGEIGNRHPDSGAHAVGDLRVACELRATGATAGVSFTLTEGRESYVFHLPGPAGDASAPSIRWSGARASESTATEALGSDWRLAAGDAVDVAVENLDDRLTLTLDGDVVATLDVAPQPRQTSTIALEVSGGGAELDDITVFRDIYYYQPGSLGSWEVDIPEGHYVVLGDNTQDSADSRAWLSVSMSWNDEGERRTEAGNFRMGLAQPNPIQATFPGGWDGQGDGTTLGWAYRDAWGERHWIPQEGIFSGPIPGARYVGTPDPFVPRNLVLGRALAVFWPLKIGRMLWRLGWLH